MSNQTLTFPPSEGFRPHVGAALTAFFSVYDLTASEFARLAVRCDLASRPPAHPPVWNCLSNPVTLSTPLRSETFSLAQPLFRRLRELAQGGCDLAGISEGGRAFTAASVAGIEIYIRDGGLASLSRACGGGILTAATWRELTQRIIRCEYVQ